MKVGGQRSEPLKGGGQRSEPRSEPLKGGGIWREGSDTCIYKPAVQCANEPDHDLTGFISRILPSSEKTDVSVENIIKKFFPDLVEHRWVSVHKEVCTPRYKAKDVQSPAIQLNVNAGCSRVPQRYPGVNPHHQNLIAPEFGPSFLSDHPTAIPLRQCIGELQTAIITAVELVPDKGPWIINTDLHANNLLRFVDRKGRHRYALHDWGRTIVIKDPNNLNSIKNALQHAQEKYLLMLYGNFRSQSHPAFLNLINHILRCSTIEQASPFLRILRCWTIFSLLYLIQVYTSGKDNVQLSFLVNNREYAAQLNPLHTAPTLEDGVHQIMRSWGIQEDIMNVSPSSSGKI